jgi:pyruvate ferredoxin oxidoreductase alpha subunit
MSIMDGFITSHSIENLEILEDKDVRKFVGKFEPEKSLLDVENPVSFGMMALPTHYFDFKVDQHNAMAESLNNFRMIADDFSRISGRQQGIFEAYQTDDAEYVVVVAGSTAGTAKETVDKLRAKGQKVGLLKIKLFRPFPHAEISEVLSGAKKIAVLDRSMSFGTFPPLYSEIVNSLYITAEHKPQIASYVYGLGGRDIFAADIEKVFENLIQGNVTNKILYIGLE